MNDLLIKLETAAKNIHNALEALNDTGDYDSADLDEATTLTERVARLIERAHNEVISPTDDA